MKKRYGNRRRPASQPVPEKEMTLMIEELGHRGDGIAHNGERAIYVPHCLPGETVKARVSGDRGKLQEVLKPSPNRIAPGCCHFGVCGGCSVQHMDDTTYQAFKYGLVQSALKARNLETTIHDVLTIPTASRRRTAFVAHRNANGALILGYHRMRSNQTFDLKECPVLEPEIEKALEKLRALAGLILPPRKTITIHVLATTQGLDIDVDGEVDWPSFALQQKLTDLIRQAGFARVCLNGETLLAPQNPTLALDNIHVTLPPGAFAQATTQSQMILLNLVKDALSDALTICDLFAGIGTFSLPLSRKAAIFAVEGNDEALAALDQAARMTPGLKAVRSEVRDLAIRPLSAKELQGFDAILLNPPRSGALAQCEILASTNAQKIVYVSCAPATFARDARILVEGDYSLLSVQPVDQFVFSHHIECVGIFERR